MIQNPISAIFFGTPDTSVEIFDYLLKSGIKPKFVVTNPDKPQGRKMIITPSPVKIWAVKNELEVLQPENLKGEEIEKILKEAGCDVFIVVAYGGIIPKKILNLPKHGTLNVHYSLLPKYRGASPVESQILNDDKDLGISIMQIDEKMDHGPIIATEKLESSFFNWPPDTLSLRQKYNEIAGKLLVNILPKWIKGDIKAVDQNHDVATYTKKINSEDRLIDLNEDAYKNLLKIQAFKTWGTYFFSERNGKKIRVNIKEAEIKDGKLLIKKVVPEGKKEMTYEEFLRGQKN
jgi:methionyl-tRNA formyltransferase